MGYFGESVLFRTFLGSVLQYITVCCSVLQCIAVSYNVQNGILLFKLGSVMQCAVVCCSVLQCVAVYHVNSK